MELVAGQSATTPVSFVVEVMRTKAENKTVIISRYAISRNDFILENRLQLALPRTHHSIVS
jgi:hypothetical protein